MERLPEQIVDWHNRHPLARRITVGDVHTIGVVALPFVRASAQAGGVVEPVLTDVVSAFDDMESAPRPSRLSAWRRRLAALTTRLPGAKPRTQWRAFNEKFLPGLSPSQIERFALAYGYAEPPAAPEVRPWRVVVIDEKLSSAHSGWPFELYLMSAAIDVGSARTRVLTGRGIPSQITGRRLWDPLRLGALAGLVALLVAAGAYALWPQRAAEPVDEPAQAASAPETVAPPAPVPSAPASAAESHVEAASTSAAEAGAASAVPGAAASAPASATESPDEAASQPDIRPRLVQRADGIQRPPLLHSTPSEAKPQDKAAEKSSEVASGKGPEKASEKAPEKPTDKPTGKATEKSPAKASEKASEKSTESADKRVEATDPRMTRMATTPGKVAVALVGPPGSKAEAEALLKKMQAAMVGVHSNPESLQGDVIQTPEGWRPTVWPFPSREQAQLINATLVARGLKTKAVNF